MAQAETRTTPRRLPPFFTYTFGMVWSGITLSAFGDGFASVALGLWVLQTTGSALAMSQILLVRAIVSVVAGPLTAGLVDRVDRQRLMIGSDIARAAVFLLIAWLMNSREGVPLLPITLLLALSTLFTTLFDPAIGASILPMVGQEQVVRANGLISFSAMAARIFGPILGGVVVKLFGGETGMIVNAASFLVSALFIGLAGKIPSPVRTGSGAGKPGLSYWETLAEGFRFLKADRLIGPLVLVLAPLVMTFATAYTLLLPVLAVGVWKADGPLYGAVQGLFAAGFSTGFLALTIFGHKLKRRGLLFGSMLVLGGILLSPLGWLPSAWAALPLLFGAGLSFALGNVLIQVALQTQVPPELQGRVIGVSQAAMNVAAPLALLLTGVLSDTAGPGIVAFGTGLGVMGAGLLSFAFPAVRRFR